MTQVLAPVAGRLLALADVPDPVFAEGLVGPGLGIDPLRGPADVVSPVSGRLVKLHPHAFVVVSEEGSGVLVHLGIDTVELKGAGFRLHVQEGSTVTAGQSIVSWHPSEIEAGGRSPICPVVALEAQPEALSELRDTGVVQAGEPLFTWSG
ncbi:MAG: PTS glucose transporter subunit IIA [Actinomycetota bacterium]|nr:PTS glucose transporter subunit IIA [Actinomycetota bacterium]